MPGAVQDQDHPSWVTTTCASRLQDRREPVARSIDTRRHQDVDDEPVKDLHTQAGLVVVGVSDMGAKIERAMHHAEKLEARELKANTAEIEADVKAASADQPTAGS
jgi:hypothetical protein